jgi:hypothetical protein
MCLFSVTEVVVAERSRSIVFKSGKNQVVLFHKLNLRKLSKNNNRINQYVKERFLFLKMNKL